MIKSLTNSLWLLFLVAPFLSAADTATAPPDSGQKTQTPATKSIAAPELPYVEQTGGEEPQCPAVGTVAEIQRCIAQQEKFDSMRRCYLHLLSGTKVPLEDCEKTELSPDRRQLALSGYKKEAGLFLMNTQDGTVKRHVLLQTQGHPEIVDFAWSPNSRYIAFTVWNSDKYPLGTRLFIQDLDHNTHRTADVSSEIVVADQGAVVFKPVWSPDSLKIAIGEKVCPADEVRFQVAVFDLSGKRISQSGIVDFGENQIRTISWHDNELRLKDGGLIPLNASVKMDDSCIRKVRRYNESLR